MRHLTGSFATALTLILAAGIPLLLVIPGDIVPAAFTKGVAATLLVTIAFIIFVLSRLYRGSLFLPPLTIVLTGILPLLAALASLAFSGISGTKAFWGDFGEADTVGFLVVATALFLTTALALRTERSFMRVGAGFLFLYAAFVVLQVVTTAYAMIAPNESFATPLLRVGDLGLLAGLATVLFIATLYRFSLPQPYAGMVYTLLGFSLAFLFMANGALAWILTGAGALLLFLHAVTRRGKVLPEEDEPAPAQAAPEAPAGVLNVSRGVTLSLVVLALAIVGLFGRTTVGGALAETFALSQAELRPSWSATISAGGSAYAENALFGSGPRGFKEAWLSGRPSEFLETPFWNVDFSQGVGYVPTMFVETGLLGAIAWTLFLLALLGLGLKALVSMRETRAHAFFALVASFIAALYLFAAAVVSVPSPWMILLAFFAAGLLGSALRFATGSEGRIVFARSPRLGFVMVFLLTIALIGSVSHGYFVLSRYAAERAFGEAAVAYQTTADVAQAAAPLDRALSLFPNDRYQRAKVLMAGDALDRVFADQGISQEDARTKLETLIPFGVEAGRAAVAADPSEYENYLSLASVYARLVPLKIQGAYENAEASYLEAEKLAPNSPRLAFLRAQLALAAGDLEKARAALTDAIARKANYTDAVFLRSQLEVSAGNLPAALADAEATLVLAPGTPAVLFQVGLLRSASGDTTGARTALEEAVLRDPGFANARYVLAIIAASASEYPRAIAELEAIAALSEENRALVAPALADLAEGRNPFPENALELPKAPLPSE